MVSNQDDSRYEAISGQVSADFELSSKHDYGYVEIEKRINGDHLLLIVESLKDTGMFKFSVELEQEYKIAGGKLRYSTLYVILMIIGVCQCIAFTFVVGLLLFKLV